MDSDTELLSIAEVARRLRKDRATVRRWIERRYLAGTHVGDRTYVSSGEVDRFVKEGQR